MSIKGIKNNLGAGLGEFMRRLDWDERVLAFGSLVRVFTLGQAARISGVTPAAISLLLVHLKRGFTGAGATVEGVRSA